jgi:hypothetical protein
LDGIAASALLTVRAARLLDRFGFSWTIAVFAPDGPKTRLGFPWILSSESRRFNELRGILREENFSRPFAAGAAAPGQEPVFLRCRNAVWFIEQA